MAAAEESPIAYEQLRDLENEFNDVETEIVRQQHILQKPLYEKREKVVSQIPNFWALVLEQAPPDVDQYIQPSDSAVLLSSLKSISVSRFEIEDGGKGNPHSLAITFEFSENEYFEDLVLEKKFWHRRAKSGWSGLVSEPVAIKWKAGKDLTSGLLDQVMAVYKQQQKTANGGSGKVDPEKFTPEEKALRKKIENTGLGGLSFFAFFGYRGMNVSAEESRLAIEKEKQQRKLRAEGNKADKDDEEDEEDGDEDADPLTLEIFPDGDELAIAFSDDVWPNALKYFLQAQEQDAMSDIDFEEFDEDDDEDEEDAPEEGEGTGGGADEPPSKKRKA